MILLNFFSALVFFAPSLLPVVNIFLIQRLDKGPEGIARSFRVYSGLLVPAAFYGSLLGLAEDSGFLFYSRELYWIFFFSIWILALAGCIYALLTYRGRRLGRIALGANVVFLFICYFFLGSI